jgi:hypothetical protein
VWIVGECTHTNDPKRGPRSALRLRGPLFWYEDRAARPSSISRQLPASPMMILA